MEKYLHILKKSPLFSGIEENEIDTMLGCLSVTTRDYEKNTYLLRFGDSVDSVGMVLSGCVHVIREDFWGNRNIISVILPGQVFAESYACMQGITLGVSVVAAEDSTVMYLNVRRILSVCSSACVFHTRLIMNLLSTLAEKSIRLNEKLGHMAQRSTREKLLSYLSSESLRNNSPSFDIPFNRQQLADYLSVDRSAMSSELSRMRDEGLLEFRRNHFLLKQD